MYFTSACLLSSNQSHDHTKPQGGLGNVVQLNASEEGEMGGCGGERQLEKVLNGNGIECVSKLLEI